MRSIEKIIKDYINRVCLNIRKCEDERELFYLYNQELSGLKEIILLNDLKIDIPHEFIEHDFDFSTSFLLSYYDGFKEIYNSSQKMSENIMIVGGKLINENGIIDKIYPKLELNISDSLKIVNCFLKHYDREIFEHFQNILDKDNLFITSLFGGNTIDGFTLSLKSIQENFIEVNMRKDILLSSNIVHEVFHSFVESHMFDIPYEGRKKRLWNNLDEVITYFSSLAFIKYLEDINFDRNSINYLVRDSAVRMIYYISSYSKYFGKSSEEIISSGFENFLLDDSVAYGTFLAYHYFDEYLKDEDRTKENILNLSLDTYLYDKNILIKEYGLSNEKLSDERVLKKILRMQGYGLQEKK